MTEPGLCGFEKDLHELLDEFVTHVGVNPHCLSPSALLIT